MGRILPRRLSRPRWPTLVWVIVAVLALAGGALLAANSDSANTDVRTATQRPETGAQPLAGQLRPLWSASAAVDRDRNVAGNTVITSSARGVRGLDPLTGQERWHYLRSTATMCDFTVLDDVIVAIFRTTGRCNEAVALEADTGVRRWYRNVGFSDRLRMLGSGTAAVAATPRGIAVLDAVGDSIRWRYNPPRGCELSSLGVGNTGVVALETCETGTTWLAEFDLYSGDQQWRVEPPADDITVVGADGVVSLLAGEELLILGARNGAVLSRYPIDADATGAAALFTGQPGGRGVPLVYVAGQLYAIDPARGTALWTVAATAAPAASEFGLVVPEVGAFVSRNPVTGAEISRSTLTEQAAPGDVIRIERADSVVVATTPDGLVGYG